MDFVVELVSWFTDPGQWSGADAIPARVVQHLAYSFAATLLAALIALPIGFVIGHTNRGATLAINLTGVGRSIPTFGIIILAFILAGINVIPVLIALTALAIPPIVTNTYAGIRAVDPEVRDSSVGMGMTGMQTLRQVEIPVAMPLIMAGLRTSAVQVVATATLAAYIGLGGLGRYIFDGLPQADVAQVVGGAVLVSALALLTESVLARVQYTATPRGIRKRDEQDAVRIRTEAKTV
ncbi:MAG: ABC transporter permease [Euzebyales bacterium]|nr:ABC transporter permease [Euzebyales bacterium]